MSVFLILLLSTITSLAMAQAFHPDIPRAWDDREVETFEVPLAQPDRSARYLSAAEYYALDVMPIYGSYPVYAPGREPAGYMEGLKDKEPEIVFDPAKLHTQEDWIRAGAIVFRAGRAYKLADTNLARDADALRSLQVPATREGIVPFFEYVVRKKGVVEVGIVSCANCHTRVLPDGTAVEGGQGSFPWAGRDAWAGSHDQRPDRDQRALNFELKIYGAPWVERPNELFATTAFEQIRRLQATQPGVIPREGTSSAFPVHIPSLIGIKDIRYLDATGLTRHRSIADLMRYAIVNQDFFGGGLQITAHYATFSRQISSRAGIATNNSMRSRSIYTRGSRLPIRIPSMKMRDVDNAFFNNKAAPFATLLRSTPITG